MYLAQGGDAFCLGFSPLAENEKTSSGRNHMWQMWSSFDLLPISQGSQLLGFLTVLIVLQSFQMCF